MTNQALIYHRPSKWPIATALGTAVLIHLSALAIAFHREPAMTQLTASDSTIFPVDVDDEQSVPPNPNASVPPPAPVPTSDFIERESPRPINTHQNSRPIRRPAQTRVAAMSNGKSSRSVPRSRITPTKRAAATSPEAVSPSLAWIPSRASPPTSQRSKASAIRFWIIPPFPPSGTGVSNRVHHLEFGSRLHFS